MAPKKATSPAKKAAAKKTAKSSTPSKRKVGKELATSGKRRGPAPKHNYELARDLYVEGVPVDPENPDGDRDWLTLREISERMNIPYQRIREVSSRNRWTEQRTRYQTESARDRQKRRQEKLGTLSIEFDERSFDIAKMGNRLIMTRLAEIARDVAASKDSRANALERLQRGEHVDKEDLWSKIRASELMELSRAAQTFQEIGRKSLGTDIERIDLNVTGSVDQNVSVTAELERDDVDRLAGFIAAADRADLWKLIDAATDDVVDGEVVEDEEHGSDRGQPATDDVPNTDEGEQDGEEDKPDQPAAPAWKR